jgi:hypothetical protein
MLNLCTFFAKPHLLRIHACKSDIIPSTTQGAPNNTQHLEQSKEFLRHILVFIQFLPCYRYYHYTILNNNQDTKILSKFFIHQLMNKRNVLKTILKFSLKQLRHVSVQSNHHQGAHYSCLLKLQLLK